MGYTVSPNANLLNLGAADATLGLQGIVDAYTTGKGHLTVRGKTEVETTKRKNVQIVITEIP